MGKIRKYSVDGCELNVPVYYDRLSGKYLEDYDLWLDGDVYTSSGHPVLVAGRDACEFAEGQNPKQCLDCAACKYYLCAAPNTWIGICTNEKNKLKDYEKEVN